MIHTGSCLCDGVQFRLIGPLEPIQICHCAQCRKAQGSAFAANIPVAATAFELISGAALLVRYASSPGKARVFCGQCGSPVFSQRDAAPETLRVRAGLIDGPLKLPLSSHAFTASKADWWTITDTLTQHPGPR
ncbi:GFA family protein [Marinobacter caseinilyticus]|uniref:GFA family protein n=1 Tax=Marinobacter caseinilyticus TaxID=2692195 RepID=UPI00140ABCC8|nr:GFA family protein [Marinobacter caseinilyticus]